MPGSPDLPCAPTAELIAEQAGDFEARVLERDGYNLLVAVDLRLSDGRVVPYRLSIETPTPVPKVREQPHRRLPGFCPNRHINHGGSFCMGWQTADALSVTDTETAAVWWGRLLKYLRQQVIAEKLGRWPAGEEWAHGDAAEHQWLAETCARALGADLVQALRSGRLTVAKKRGAGGFFALMNAGRRIYSVLSEPQRVATLRQACFCGSGRTLRSCADHAARAADLVAALMAWQKAETAFWEEVRGLPCCETLHKCPLRTLPEPANINSEQIAGKAA